MTNFFFAVYSQALLFLPLALGICISFNILKATDMTLDGSFVLGAASYAILVTHGYSPYLGLITAILSGAGAGSLTATIQRGGKIDPLLAGVLGMFILSSFNLILMGKPNITLLNSASLFNTANQSNSFAYVTLYVILICSIVAFSLRSRFGLTLRALGDNPFYLQRLGKKVELYRLLGFATTNALAALSGCFTAQIVGYADINMGFGMTLTGIGTIILGQQLLMPYLQGKVVRIGLELIAILLGISCYFILLNLLLRLEVNPIYLKMIIGFLLIIFLRTAIQKKAGVRS